ncbi:hypothetical protein [Paraflavitalea pollutisoli]|uniref:hypothetical protein n=1 Tax=Paraflavitalea pollutisoli TaxID=3034143 RepID=UPI0023EB45DF|nr:hypothetical protein [Paraflavitalea sp. H1-2-19X]
MSGFFAPDKKRHFYVGILMGFVLQAMGYWLWPGQPGIVIVSVFLLGIFISYGFELFSKVTGWGIYDFMDAVFSAIGSVLGQGLAILLWSLFSR